MTKARTFSMATATEATDEKDMHQMQQREKGNGLSAYQGSWTNAASILVRQLHEGVLQGVSLGKTQEMRPVAHRYGLAVGGCRQETRQDHRDSAAEMG
jgi:hypothetical protein